MRAILTWHSIDATGSVISVSPEVFKAQLASLARLGLRVVSVPELLALDPDADAVALTFDDGFLNFRTHAWPVLCSHGFSATVFVVSDHVGGDNRWRGRADHGIPTLPLLGWDDLAELRSEGAILAAHTRTHPHLTTLGDAALEDELTIASAEIARRTGADVEGFAYPYGELDARVAARATERYRWACTTEYRALGASERPVLLPRLDAWYFRDPSRLDAWGTPRFKAGLWLRRQARRVRSAMSPVRAA